jgi:putative component of membrane protein insertase Oxa1/YidC/SpoIIIJ protein YidD
MILAIDKFGLIIGVSKGIRRLMRCNPSNGGDDFP